MNIDFTFLTGVIGAILIVLGSALPEKRERKEPHKSIKSWLFSIGTLVLLLYAVLNYFEGGPIFFIFLEILLIIASFLMMLNTDDRDDTIIITITGAVFLIWSIILFESYTNIAFIIGLTTIAYGYAYAEGSIRRTIALTVGGLMIAIFSYTERSWIFFWLNTFFFLFSGYYLLLAILHKTSAKKLKTK